MSTTLPHVESSGLPFDDLSAEQLIKAMEKDNANCPDPCDYTVSTTKYKAYSKVPYPLNENGADYNYQFHTITINKQYLFLNINKDTGDYYYQLIDTVADASAGQRYDSGLQSGKLDIAALPIEDVILGTGCTGLLSQCKGTADVNGMNNNIIVISNIDDDKYIINVYSIDVGFNKQISSTNSTEPDTNNTLQFTYKFDFFIISYRSITTNTFNSSIFYVFATVPDKICVIDIYKFSYSTGFIEKYTVCTGLLAQCKGTSVPSNSRPLRVGLELDVDGTVNCRATHIDFFNMNIPIEDREQINKDREFLFRQDTQVKFIAEDIIIYTHYNIIYIADLKQNSQTEYDGIKTHLKNIKPLNSIPSTFNSKPTLSGRELNGTPVPLHWANNPVQTVSETLNILSTDGLVIYVNHANLHIENDPIACTIYFIMNVDACNYGVYQLQIKNPDPADKAPEYSFAGPHKLVSAPLPYIKYPALNILFMREKLYLIDYPLKDNFNIYSLDTSQDGQEPVLELSSYQFELEEPNYKKEEEPIYPVPFTTAVPLHLAGNPVQTVPGLDNISAVHLSLIESERDSTRYYHDCIDSLDTIIIYDNDGFKFFNARLDKVNNLEPVREISNKLGLDLPDEILLDVAYMAYKPAPVYNFNLLDCIPSRTNSNLANINWAETVKYTIQDDFKNPWLPDLSPENPIINSLMPQFTSNSNQCALIFNNNTAKPLLDTEYEAYLKAYKENTPIYEPKQGQEAKIQLALREPQYQIIYPILP